MQHRVLLGVSTALALATLAPAQTISRTSAPAIGRTLTIDYSATPGNVYAMFLSSPPFAPIPVPPFGTFFLNPFTLFYFYSGAVPGGGTHSVGQPIPNDLSLVNGTIGLQAFDATALLLSTNFAELSFSLGIGTITAVEGPSSVASTGSLDTETIVNATAGAPVTQGLGNVAIQGITHYGWQGYRPLVTSTGTTATEQADIDVEKLTSVCQDGREPTTVHMSLPNGFDLYVCRDAVNQRTFFLASLHRASGIVTRLTGSTVTDLGTASLTPTSMYRPQFAFSQDGNTAVCVVHDTTNTPVGNVGPQDRVLLVKTNPAVTFSNGFNVFDASPVPGPDRIHTTYNGSIRIGANGYGLVEGEEPSGVTGEAALWGGPTDGSAVWTRITVPNTGTGRPFYWSYSVWRHTADGATDVFLSGGNGGLSTDHMDVMAIRNLGTGTPTVVNITAFPASNQVLTWGQSGTGAGGLRGALSPDGTRVAIVLGAGTVASPNNMCIVRTDGSDAGTVTSFTQGRYDPQVISMNEVWWITNTRVIFTAGSSTTAGDLYVYDTASATISNLTRTTTGSQVPPFTQGGTVGNLALRGSFMSDNGAYYYFVRGHTTTTTGLGSDWKGLNVASLALFDVSGNEFSGGSTSSLRPISTAVATWFPRRHPVTNELYFTTGKNSGISATIADDEVWRFNPEVGTPTVQVTTNNATGTATTVQRIQDLVLDVTGTTIAYAQGVGTATTVAEDLYVMPAIGGPRVKVSRTPTTGGQGIARGSVHFGPTALGGISWVQGTNARINPTVNTVAMWNSLVGGTAPLRLTAAPSATAKFLMILNVSPLNP